jgi:hypothetical protein
VRHPIAAVIAIATVGLGVVAAGTSFAVTHHSGPAATVTARPAAPVHRVVWKPPGPHRGVDLNVLVVTDGSPPAEAIRQQLTTEGIPVTVLDLRARSRPRITVPFLVRGDQVRAGAFDGIVLPSADPAGLSGAELGVLAKYERAFGVREVDAYTPPTADVGMTAPTYSGPLAGPASVTSAGLAAGFGYLNASFPFSGGLAGPAPFGYLADPLPGSTALVNVAMPGGSGSLVWQSSDGAGRLRLGIGFGYGWYLTQFHFLAPGLVSWLTRGVYLGDDRTYLDIGYDDMFLGDAQWSPTGHCTPRDTTCPRGTPMTPIIRMTPADVTYAVRWEQQHHFTIEFLYNGGASKRFRINGADPLLAAIEPVAGDFYWVNHTYSHAYMGCQQDFTVVPWKCVTSGGNVVWAADLGLISSQISDNFAWARQNGIPAEPGLVATGEYSGLRLLPQQTADNPYLAQATTSDHISWLALDASREPVMRPVGAALGIPRHPIDVGYDVSTVAAEVNEFNWYNTSKASGGSGLCQVSTTTACAKPLDPATGWTSVIVPGQAQIVFAGMLANDPRPFFMHQSNLTGDRLAYQVMDAVLSAYRAVFSDRAPVVNLPMNAGGVALHDQELWAQALRTGTVSAWVQGRTLTIDGPPGTTVPVTVPSGTSVVRSYAGGSLTQYAGEISGYVTLGAHPLTFRLP